MTSRSLPPRHDPVATGARCYDPQWTNTRLFFSERPLDIAKAKMICAGCDLRDDCLAGAKDRAEPVGVWGGECFHNGRIVETRRRRGRPRKDRTAATGDGPKVPMPERSHARRLPRGARHQPGAPAVGGLLHVALG